MKKALSMFLSLMMTATLVAGCGDSGSSGGGSAASGGSGGDDTVYTIRIADTVQDDSIYIKAYNEVFLPYIEEHANGRIVMERYGNSQLGSDQQLAESLQLGTIEMAMIPMSCIGGFDADFMAIDLPFLYDDAQTAYNALAGEWGDMFAEKLEAIHIKKLGWEENSFRNFSSNKPIRTLADMKGQKMRVMESTVYVETMKALGAAPTPMAFSELYTALQNGTVDGQDNGPVLTYTSKLFEVQKYYTISNYVYAASMVAASLDWWNTLPADIQDVLVGASLAFQDAERQDLQNETENYIGMLEDEGMEIIRLDADTIQDFREACAPVYDIVRDSVDGEIVDMALSVNDTYKS